MLSMDSFILRTEVEDEFINYILSPFGDELRNKCVELFNKPLIIGQNVDFWSIEEDKNVNALLNIYCDSSTYKEESSNFIIVFTFETLREYEDNLLKTDTTNNVWRELLRPKTEEFMGLVRKTFSDMLQDNGINGHKRFKIIEVVTSEPPLQADTTIQQDMGIEISLDKCLINQ